MDDSGPRPGTVPRRCHCVSTRDGGPRTIRQDLSGLLRTQFSGFDMRTGKRTTVLAARRRADPGGPLTLTTAQGRLASTSATSFSERSGSKRWAAIGQERVQRSCRASPVSTIENKRRRALLGSCRFCFADRKKRSFHRLGPGFGVECDVPFMLRLGHEYAVESDVQDANPLRKVADLDRYSTGKGRTALRRSVSKRPVLPVGSRACHGHRSPRDWGSESP